MSKGATVFVKVVSWLIFVTTWFSILIRSVSHWRSIPNDLHTDILLLVIFFAGLWVQLVRDKSNALDLLLVSLTLTAVSDLVSRIL